MRVFAISPDEPAASASFARAYAIGFPLLADVDRAVAAAYVGVDTADNTIPGIVIVDRGGRVGFRQIATAKDDRLDAAGVIAAVDRTLGASGPAAYTRYAVLERLQLRVEAIAGIRDGERHGGAGVELAVPAHHNLLVTARVRGEEPGGLYAGEAGLVVRWPILADAAALQAGVAAGHALAGEPRDVVSARAGAWVALTPAWAIQLDVGLGWNRPDGNDGSSELDVFATLGLARLFEIR